MLDYHSLYQLISKQRTIIAIDGPGASGKSSLGKQLAKILQMHYLDTGQIYRLFIWFCQNQKITTAKLTTLLTRRLKTEFSKKINFQNQQIYFQQSPINAIPLHTQQMDVNTADFVYQKWVRKTVNAVCNKIIKEQNFVVVGRDVNAVICPFANYKFFLTANLQARAKRKYLFWQNQTKDKKSSSQNEVIILKKIENELYQRDEKDVKFQIQQIKIINSKIFGNKTQLLENDSMSTWENMQLENGARKIDNSHLTLDETLNKVLQTIKTKQTNLEEVVIIGETNVGKSTLFNILSAEEALVSQMAHTTRDVYKTKIQISPNHHFWLTDTGGVNGQKTNQLLQKITQKTKKTIEQANYLLWVVDYNKPISKENQIIKKWIKWKKQKTILVINKVEKQTREQKAKFNQLGVKNQVLISAKYRKNISNLKNMISNNITSQSDPQSNQNPINVLLLGKVNVGKSSIFNAFFQENIAITHNEPHTTTNIIKKAYFYQNYQINFIDTAGIRKKRNERTIIEEKSLIQIKKILIQTDLAILIYAMDEERTIQEKKIAKLIIAIQKPFFVIANKLDLIKGGKKKVVQEITHFIPRVKKEKIPIFTISAKVGLIKKIDVLKTIIKMFQKEKKEKN